MPSSLINPYFDCLAQCLLMIYTCILLAGVTDLEVELWWICLARSVDPDSVYLHPCILSIKIYIYMHYEP